MLNAKIIWVKSFFILVVGFSMSPVVFGFFPIWRSSKAKLKSREDHLNQFCSSELLIFHLNPIRLSLITFIHFGEDVPNLSVLQHTMKAVPELQGAHCQYSNLLCSTVWIHQGDCERSFCLSNLGHQVFPFHPRGQQNVSIHTAHWNPWSL